MGTVNMSALAMETFWLNKSACDDAERAYYEKLSGCKVDTLATGLSSSEEMALVKKLNALETENKQLKKVTDDLKALVLSLEARVGSLEGGKPAAKPAPAPAAAAEDDDDVDLFGSDDEEEDEEKKRITEERLKAYHEKKAKKPQVIAKTSVLFDVKPWDDETPHEKMLEACKSIEKLQIMCTVEDAKVSIEELGEQIEAFEDYVQSVDVAAMNKIRHNHCYQWPLLIKMLPFK